MRYLLFVYILLNGKDEPWQHKYLAHVVYDSAQGFYAVKVSAKGFAKFEDSLGQFKYYSYPTKGYQFRLEGTGVREVPAGQETTFTVKAQADAFLDFWNTEQSWKDPALKKRTYGD